MAADAIGVATVESVRSEVKIEKRQKDEARGRATSRAEAEAIGTTSTENEHGTPQNASRVGVVSSTRSISPKQQRNAETTRPRHTSGAAAGVSAASFRQSTERGGVGALYPS